jgi:acetate kinase
MTDHILTLNAGSSSLKFALFSRANLTSRATGQVDGLGTTATLILREGGGRRYSYQVPQPADPQHAHADAVKAVFARLRQSFPAAAIAAVGHRIVHGGLSFTRPVRITDDTVRILQRLIPLAPLHQPHNLAGIAAAAAAFPDAEQIACFDTAFHRTHDFVHDTFAIPRFLYDDGVRRYGFHGLSYEYIASCLPAVAPQHAAGRVIVCHLGAGASVCGLSNGRSVSSTMGFSPLDGLPMATRPGQLDPAVVLYLMAEKGLSADAISDLLYRQSGLKGLSGISGDMRDLEASSSPDATGAIAYFVSRLTREIGAMTAVLGGCDAIVFCGGIGENSANVRQAALVTLGWLGVEISPERNIAHAIVISSPRSRVGVYVIPTNEELMIARHVANLIAAPPR